MYETKILTLEELTEPILKERPSIAFTEINSGDCRLLKREPVFITKESWGTPLGLMSVEFTTEGQYFSEPAYKLWFRNKTKTAEQEPHLYIDINFCWKMEKVESRKGSKYSTQMSVSKGPGYKPEELPSYINKITLTEGMQPDDWNFIGHRLSKLKRKYGGAYIATEDNFGSYFIGKMLSLMELRLPDKYDKEDWKTVWNSWYRGFTELSKQYADYTTGERQLDH